MGYDQAVEMAVSESSVDGIEMEEADDDGRRLQYRTRRQGLRGRRGHGRRQGGRYRTNGRPGTSRFPGGGGGTRKPRTNGILGTSNIPGGPPPPPPVTTPPLPTNYCSGGTWCTIFSGGCVTYTFGTPVNPSLTYCPSGTICFDPMTYNQCIVW